MKTNPDKFQAICIGKKAHESIDAFKIENKTIKGFINIKVTNYNLRRDNTAEVPRASSTRYGLRSFRFEAAKVWNILRNDLRQIDSYQEF